MSEGQNTGVRLERVTVVFDGRPVLQDFSLHVPYHAVTALLGPSGRGKTTVARLLLGLLQPQSGRVSGALPHRAAVFQDDCLQERFDAVDNILLALPNAPARDVALRHLAALGLDAEAARQAAATLSGGQKRRVQLVRCMLTEADFMVLDEPFKGLDENTKAVAMAYVKTHTAGKTVLLITHDAKEAAALAAHVVHLDAAQPADESVRPTGGAKEQRGTGMLYQLCGVVSHGKKMGRKLGFPTANVLLDRDDMPHGVYVARAHLADGRLVFGVLNHGLTPTLPSGQKTAEAHLFDVAENLYGQRITLEYLHFLRPERSFDTADRLAAQVRQDIVCAKAWLRAQGSSQTEDQ